MKPQIPKSPQIPQQPLQQYQQPYQPQYYQQGYQPPQAYPQQPRYFQNVPIARSLSNNKKFEGPPMNYPPQQMQRVIVYQKTEADYRQNWRNYIRSQQIPKIRIFRPETGFDTKIPKQAIIKP